jgi:hypothetical protein
MKIFLNLNQPTTPRRRGLSMLVKVRAELHRHHHYLLSLPRWLTTALMIIWSGSAISQSKMNRPPTLPVGRRLVVDIRTPVARASISPAVGEKAVLAPGSGQ